MIIVGIDLAGPANHQDTGVVWFDDGGAVINFQSHLAGATDHDIVQTISTLGNTEEVCVGLDAPLSYNDGGKMRQRDRDLQRRIIKVGMQPGSVMAPTFTKMAYLTLRGFGVSRCLGQIQTQHQVTVVETHPGATFGLRGAPIDAVRNYRSDVGHRDVILNWLRERGVQGLPNALAVSPHLISACGCALGAWKWVHNEFVWRSSAEPPHHPFDFAC